MEFFKSVFSDDPDPPSHSYTVPDRKNPDDPDPKSDPKAPPRATAGAWGFGGFKSVLETYRRDLQEFGSGLKKETELLREVAGRAVKDLPTSIEIGASSAHGAFDSIGASVWKSTAEIIAQGKESLLSVDLDSDGLGGANNDDVQSLSGQSVNQGRYSRFDAQVRGIQCEVSTFVEEIEDLEEYKKWKEGFHLGEKREEMEGLMRENETMNGIYKRVVPSVVDHDTFWFRYYCRVHRLKQAESVRANLVKRAFSREDEEELSWDVDDDEWETGGSLANATNKASEGVNVEYKVIRNEDSSKSVRDDKSRDDDVFKDMKEKPTNEELQVESSVIDVEKALANTSEVEKTVDVVEYGGERSFDKEVPVVEAGEVKNNESQKKLEEKVISELKVEPTDLGKDSDISVVSSQPSPEEDDLGWDEIENIGSDDDKKVTRGGSPDRAELRKRLSIAEDEEDLSWDIEDDDEPIKT